MLQAIDKMWQRHINDMDALREGVRLRAQGQRDPLVEYKREAYGLFETLMQDIHHEMVKRLFRSTTNLSAFEEFLASLPATPTQSDDANVEELLANNDLLTALREQLQLARRSQQRAEQEEEAATSTVDPMVEASLSGVLPPGLPIREKKIDLPNRRNRLVNIRRESANAPDLAENGGAAEPSSAPIYTPEDSTPSL